MHSHLGASGCILAGLPGPPVLHTWHTQVYVDAEWFAGRHPDLRVAAVSEFQAIRFRRAGARHCAVIHNGVDLEAFDPSPRRSGPLVFIGRIDATKGPDLAVRTARALGLQLEPAAIRARGRAVRRAHGGGEVRGAVS